MKEFKTKEHCQKYLIDNMLGDTEFYFNVYGWSTYYTLEPTFATPTGKLEDFPRTVLIKNSIGLNGYILDLNEH